jgi:hypothetical protein
MILNMRPLVFKYICVNKVKLYAIEVSKNMAVGSVFMFR